jgi:hypothetical protein
MASLIYNSCIRDALVGNINFSSDTFKMLLVTSSYSAAKSHAKRNNITNEVTGTGYSTGGNTCAVTVEAVDNVNNDVEVSFTVASWTTATITARGGVIYKSRGGASSADELVGYVDFGGDISSTNGTFAVTVTTPLKFQN